MGTTGRDVLDDVLDVFEAAAPRGAPLTTSEVAGHLECTHRTAYNRLDQLVERGELETKKVGARGRVWWRRRAAGAPTGRAGPDVVAGDAPASPFASLADRAESYAVFLLDSDGRVVTWNPGAERITGYERDEVLGAPLSTLYPEEAVDDGVPDAELARASARGSVESEGWRVRADGSRFRASVAITALAGDDGGPAGFGVIARDVTDRHRYEEHLRGRRDELEAELDEVFERVDDAFFALDTDWRFAYVNDRTAELVGLPVYELLGTVVWRTLPEVAEGRPRRLAERAMETQESAEFEFYSSMLETWFEVKLYPSETGLSVYFSDVTGRKERELELERYETIVETVDDGIYVVDSDGRFVLVNAAYAEMTGYAREELIGAPVSLVVDEATGERARELEDELLSGARATARLEADVVTAGGDRFPAEATFAVLGGEAGHGRVGVVRDVTERIERERELERQRERLAALDDLNAVVREITEAVIEQSTREEIERTLCDLLASSDSYALAWVGDVDTSTGTVEPRVAAGVEGYLDGLTISVDPEDPRARGPTGRAVLTGEMQVMADARSDEAYEAWRRRADEYGFRSSAAIPIVHEGTLYSVLNVYAERPGAFAGAEREVIGQLGEVVGHAIAAVERKRALMNDEVLEIEFRFADRFGPPDVGAPPGGRITIDGSVPTSDEAYLVFGSVTPDAVATLDGYVESLPHWETLTVLDDRDGPARFRARLSEPPVLSAVAAQGGRVEEVVIEESDVRMTLHLDPGADVRGILDTIEAHYPSVEMLTRRQLTRPVGPPNRLDRVLDRELTDRQRASLEAAFNGGYFEWPRLSTGEDIADAMGVAPATFHQHLRKAEAKVLGSVLSGAGGGERSTD